MYSTRFWPSTRSGSIHPERSHPLIDPPVLTGVCFSGGSTRSYAATVGHLRGLIETGLISHVGYVSSVSGGAWAATPYTYYDGVASSDIELLGEYREPERLTFEDLEEIAPQTLGYAATQDFGQILARAKKSSWDRPEKVWSQAVRQMFLKPYGLGDPTDSAGFTLNDDIAQEIYGRNKCLRKSPLRTTWNRSYRPYLLVHATLNWAKQWPEECSGHRIGLEYAPLGVGVSPIIKLRQGADRLSVGCGFVEPFAFGGGFPQNDGCGNLIKVGQPERVLTIADMVGASSAFTSADQDVRNYAQVDCWPVREVADSNTVTSRLVLTDGGDLENYGLISLLRRGVRGVVVFINSLWPLRVDYDPTTWPDDLDLEAPTKRQLDPFLAPLFGAPSLRFPHNHVFPKSDYQGVVTGLQDAKRRGDTVMTVSTHTIQSNQWWGLEGGNEVKVCWVYNDTVASWNDRLSPKLKALVIEGQKRSSGSPYARFPHYLTRGQNPGSLIRLTAGQTNLLMHLSSWNVVSNCDALRMVLE